MFYHTTGKANEYVILHEMKSKHNVETLLYVNNTPLSDESNKLDIVFNDVARSNYYNVKNMEFKIAISDETDVVDCFYSSGAGTYYKPQYSYENNQRIISFNADSKYFEFILITNNTKENVCKPEIDIKYSLRGKGIYSFNKFDDINPKFVMTDDEHYKGCVMI